MTLRSDDSIDQIMGDDQLFLALHRLEFADTTKQEYNDAVRAVIVAVLTAADVDADADDDDTINYPCGCNTSAYIVLPPCIDEHGHRFEVGPARIAVCVRCGYIRSSQ